jgi:hypothetical protein
MAERASSVKNMKVSDEIIFFFFPLNLRSFRSTFGLSAQLSVFPLNFRSFRSTFGLSAQPSVFSAQPSVFFRSTFGLFRSTFGLFRSTFGLFPLNLRSFFSQIYIIFV